jgi:Flp pilus assembly protein TadD
MRYAVLLLPLALAACNGSGLGFSAKDFLGKSGETSISSAEQNLLTSAKQAEASGDYAKARGLYQQLLDRAPTNKDYAFGLAEALRRTGELDGAIKLYSQLVAARPEMVDAYEGKGLAQLAKADMEGASYSFAEVMNRDPGRWRTLNAIGVLFAGKKMYSEARQYFTAALGRSPNNATVLNNTGLVLAMEKDSFSAINALQKAAGFSTNKDQRARVELNAALVYAVSGDMKNAEILARRHLEGAQLSNNLGLYAHLAKDDVLAKSYLNMALTESKVYYEKAWDNLQNVQATKAEEAAPTALKIQ